VRASCKKARQMVAVKRAALIWVLSASIAIPTKGFAANKCADLYDQGGKTSLLNADWLSPAKIFASEVRATFKGEIAKSQISELAAIAAAKSIIAGPSAAKLKTELETISESLNQFRAQVANANKDAALDPKAFNKHNAKANFLLMEKFEAISSELNKMKSKLDQLQKENTQLDSIYQELINAKKELTAYEQHLTKAKSQVLAGSPDNPHSRALIELIVNEIEVAQQKSLAVEEMIRSSMQKQVDNLITTDKLAAIVDIQYADVLTSSNLSPMRAKDMIEAVKSYRDKQEAKRDSLKAWATAAGWIGGIGFVANWLFSNPIGDLVDPLVVTTSEKIEAKKAAADRERLLMSLRSLPKDETPNIRKILLSRADAEFVSRELLQVVLKRESITARDLALISIALPVEVYASEKDEHTQFLQTLNANAQYQMSDGYALSNFIYVLHEAVLKADLKNISTVQAQALHYVLNNKLKQYYKARLIKADNEGSYDYDSIANFSEETILPFFKSLLMVQYTEDKHGKVAKPAAVKPANPKQNDANMAIDESELGDKK
jgi:hypothetical protein